MKIAYLSTDSIAPKAKERKPSKRELAMASADRWAAIQNQANYRVALKKYDDRIKAIKEVDPLWSPDRIMPK